ncbi:hypothetical protein NG799_20520 [Laspinema sp. D1]|uniref:Uncharacterized protein n=1 Tax=Laspinema palackyanum D2a TaxID=2953684 RepID=A0ABT2MVB6_9CYAN|nr:hypothetical protein [Laspinema sp. D2b]MCT7968695.1 hypothetical protein [Laspinema sp. D2a]
MGVEREEVAIASGYRYRIGAKIEQLQLDPQPVLQNALISLNRETGPFWQSAIDETLSPSELKQKPSTFFPGTRKIGNPSPKGDVSISEVTKNPI